MWWLLYNKYGKLYFVALEFGISKFNNYLQLQFSIFTQGRKDDQLIVLCKNRPRVGLQPAFKDLLVYDLPFSVQGCLKAVPSLL